MLAHVALRTLNRAIQSSCLATNAFRRRIASLMMKHKAGPIKTTATIHLRFRLMGWGMRHLEVGLVSDRLPVSWWRLPTVSPRRALVVFSQVSISLV